MSVAIHLALTALRILLSSGILSRIESMVLLLMDTPRLPGETKEQYNLRRRDYVIDTIKAEWPAARTALLEAAIGLTVVKLRPEQK